MILTGATGGGGGGGGGTQLPDGMALLATVADGQANAIDAYGGTDTFFLSTGPGTSDYIKSHAVHALVGVHDGTLDSNGFFRAYRGAPHPSGNLAPSFGALNGPDELYCAWQEGSGVSHTVTWTPNVNLDDVTADYTLLSRYLVDDGTNRRLYVVQDGVVLATASQPTGSGVVDQTTYWEVGASIAPDGANAVAILDMGAEYHAGGVVAVCLDVPDGAAVTDANILAHHLAARAAMEAIWAFRGL